jgi:GTPase
VDSADPSHEERIEDVLAVLREIGADQLPRILVYNKIDILGIEPRVDRAETGLPARIWLSSRTGAGLELLPGAIAEFIRSDSLVRGTAELSVAQARLRALLYERGVVLAERERADGGWDVDVEMDHRGYEDLSRREQLRLRADMTTAPSVAAH